MVAEEILEQWQKQVSAGDVDAVRRLFAEHPGLAEHVNDPRFPFDRSAVHVCRENLPLIDLLVEHGAQLNQKSSWWAGGFGILEGLSPEAAAPLIERGATVDIWAAVCLNDHDAVREMLSADPELVRAPGGDGKHPLHDAQDVEMVDLLVEAGADVDARCVDHESTPLHYQIQNRDVVDRLLEHGATPDVFAAAALDDPQLLRACLEANPACCDMRLGLEEWNTEGNAAANIYNWTLGHDATPQQVARMRSSDQVLPLLLQHASPQRRLMDAIWEADRERVDTLLAEHPNLLKELSLDDHRALARAAWWYRPEAVKLMLRLGFTPNVPGIHQSTPLDRAAFHGYSDIVELLLTGDPQPPVHVRNEFGGTPLGACLHGFRFGWTTGHPQDHQATVELLLAAGSKVEHYMLQLEGLGDLTSLLQAHS